MILTTDSPQGHAENVVSTLVVETCPTCHIVYAIPETLKRAAKVARGAMSVYCPNGHSWHYIGKTEAEIAREERDRALRRAEAAERDATWQGTQRKIVERTLIAVKGHGTRLRKRIAAGVCPCCTRTFQNLAAHMAGQHPSYVVTDKDAQR